MTDLLNMMGIVKEFPGVRALDGVDLDVRAGDGGADQRRCEESVLNLTIRQCRNFIGKLSNCQIAKLDFYGCNR